MALKIPVAWSIFKPVSKTREENDEDDRDSRVSLQTLKSSQRVLVDRGMQASKQERKSKRESREHQSPGTRLVLGDAEATLNGFPVSPRENH